MSESLQSTIKQYLMEQVRNFDIDELRKRADKDDTITLYHGTNTFYLNSILENGILPRNITGNNNWEKEEALANEDVVYLTNKWHYRYAYNSVEQLLKNKYGEDWSQKEEGQWWINGKLFPIYLEIVVPKEYLAADEDLLYSKYVKDAIKAAVKKNGELKIDLTWENSLAHHGTVAVRGGVPKEWIKSIHILGDGHLYLDLMEEGKPYQKEMRKWFNGKGKGKIKNKDLKAMEKKYKYTGEMPVAAIPPGYKLSQCVYNKELGMMTFIGNTPEDLLNQPMKLEII